MRDHVYERSADETPTQAVVSALADATNQSPLEMDPLAESIDPDALNEICRSEGDAASFVQFQHCDRMVTVDSDEIRVA